MLRNFGSLAKTVESNVHTDIPLNRLPTLVRLASGIEPSKTVTLTFGLDYVFARRVKDRLPGAEPPPHADGGAERDPQPRTAEEDGNREDDPRHLLRAMRDATRLRTRQARKNGAMLVLLLIVILILALGGGIFISKALFLLLLLLILLVLFRDRL